MDTPVYITYGIIFAFLWVSFFLLVMVFRLGLALHGFVVNGRVYAPKYSVTGGPGLLQLEHLFTGRSVAGTVGDALILGLFLGMASVLLWPFYLLVSGVWPITKILVWYRKRVVAKENAIRRLKGEPLRKPYIYVE